MRLEKNVHTLKKEEAIASADDGDNLTDSVENASSEEKAVIDKSLPTGDENKKSDPFDVEELRQRAATKRKEQEELETKKNLLNSSKMPIKQKLTLMNLPIKKYLAPKNKKLLDSDDDELKRKANKGKKLQAKR